MNDRRRSLFALVVRLYLGGVFLAAAWHKILDPGAFAVDVATYRMLPPEAVNPLALVLPWVELVAGVGLVLGLRARGAALLVAGMMTLFTVALASALFRGLDLGCGCFASTGLTEHPISGWTLARDLVWLMLAGWVALRDRRPLGLDRLLERTP